MPVSGVRSSWLTLETKVSSLSRRSPRSRVTASSSASCSLTRSLMSSEMHT